LRSNLESRQRQFTGWFMANPGRGNRHPIRASEADILRAVMDYLSARNFRVFRRNVMGIVPMAKGGAVHVGVKGQADLYGWFRYTGIHIEVEVKRPGGTLTPEQGAWLDNARADGAVAFMVDSVEECRLQLKKFGF